MKNEKDKPELSIVIISYNTLQMTRDCLESIYRCKSGLSIEIIVVDNNSKDGSAEMIRDEFPEVHLICNTDNKGFAAANNQGFKVCRGDYILLLNSDTVVLNHALTSSIDFLKQRPEAGAMGLRLLNKDGSMQPSCSGYPTLVRLLIMTLSLDRLSALSFLDHYQMRSWQRDSEREVDVISGCYLLIRREVLTQVGGLDDSFFFFGEETDWCRRIREAGWKLFFSPVGQIIHYGGGSVKKLNYKRDIMLTSGLVRLHLKHGGLFNGFLAYLILMFFNVSRSVIWTIISLFKSSKKVRAEHFRNVVLSYKNCWPR